jgi:hypothetical protein
LGAAYVLVTLIDGCLRYQSATSANGGDRIMWRKPKGLPIPEESRYDRMTNENLFLTLEANVGTATTLVDLYRGSPDPERELSLLQVELEGALVACKALRRKLL